MTESGPRDPGSEADAEIDWSRGGQRAQAHAGEPSSTPQTAGPRVVRNRTFSFPVVAAVALLAAIVGGVAGGASVLWLDDGSGDGGVSPAATTLQNNPTIVSVEMTGAVEEVAELGRASVVRIEGRRRGSDRVDVGSGVVIDELGHVVTNAHVVVGTDVLRVFLPDGTEQSALLIGHDDPFTDVAVLLISPGAAPALPVGDSSTLKPGETVVAVGNPLSTFAGSVSVGVVSGVNRTRILAGVRYDDLVQTDAALNSGNSGGALLNLLGQFVAMPTAVMRESDSGLPVAGIGFALPAAHVMAIANEIIALGGAIERASIGAAYVHLTPEVARTAGFSAETAGALITAVEADGPADEAGLEAGDLVTMFGGVPVDQEHPLLNALAGKSPGEIVTIAFARNGRVIETQMRLGRRS